MAAIALQAVNGWCMNGARIECASQVINVLPADAVGQLELASKIVNFAFTQKVGLVALHGAPASMCALTLVTDCAAFQRWHNWRQKRHNCARRSSTSKLWSNHWSDGSATLRWKCRSCMSR